MAEGKRRVEEEGSSSFMSEGKWSVEEEGATSFMAEGKTRMEEEIFCQKRPPAGLK